MERNQILKSSAIAALIAVLLLIVPVMYAQPAVKIKSLFLVGKGIAVSPSDPLDFKLASVGVASIETSASSVVDKVLKIGILRLDDEKYRVRNVTRTEGEISGSLYLNKSKVGEFKVSSVMKERTIVWAGTLSLNGKEYYLYILEGIRKIKPIELKDKISDYCKANRNDTNCRERIADYCQKNPDDSRCKEIFRNYCINNSEDIRCREYVRSYCEENPEKRVCRLLKLRLSAKFCEENPDSRYCLKLSKDLVDYCLKNPNTEKCRNFCSEYPDKCLKVVKNLADFCVNNANHTSCIEYCKKYPRACVKLTKNLIDLCIKNPNNEKCVDYCKAHPVACKKVTKELAQFCIGREADSKCVNYCREHPGACKRIAVKLEGYCSKNRDTEECKIFCSKFPNKCAVEKPIVAVEETVNEVEPVAVSRKIVKIVNPVQTRVKAIPSVE